MKTVPAWAPALIRLLQGPVYSSNQKTWDLILRYRRGIENYFAQIGLELLFAEHDGLAFLRKKRDSEENNEDEVELPELMQKRELPYTASILAVLLVEELYRFESAGGGQARLVLSRQKIQDMLSVYLPAGTNEAKQADYIDTQINNLLRYGFLRKLGNKNDELEVTRLLKYKIDARTIAEIKERLLDYTEKNNG